MTIRWRTLKVSDSGFKLMYSSFNKEYRVRHPETLNNIDTEFDYFTDDFEDALNTMNTMEINYLYSELKTGIEKVKQLVKGL